MDLILDTSIVVDLTTDLDPAADELRQSLERISTSESRWIIRSVTWIEYANALRGLEHRRQVDADWAEYNIAHFAAFPARRMNLTAYMLRRAWEMRASATAYDAVYLAATEERHLTTGQPAALVTGDRRLAGSSAARVGGVRVMVYPDDF